MKREGIFVVLTFCLLVVMTIYANCGMHLREPEKVNLSQSVIQNNQDLSISESWAQPTQAEQIIKPEVVFVVDYSGSVGGWSQRFLDSLSGWLGQLQSAGINDMCMGVMKAGIHQGTAGVLQAPAGNKKCYCTFGANAVTHTALVTKFIENFNHAWTTISGGPNEEAAIYSLHQSLNDQAIKASNQIDGCFAGDTSLIPIFLSDEGDISVSWDSNGNQLADDSKYLPAGSGFSNLAADVNYNNQTWITGRKQHHATDASGNVNTNAAGEIVNLIDFETVADDLAAFNGSYPSFGTAIGHIQGTGKATYWGGMQFADHFGKPMLDLDNAIIPAQAPQFEAEMNSMASDIAIGLAYFYQFNLGQNICDQNNNGLFTDESVEVKVDGSIMSTADYAVSADGSKIILDPSISYNPGSVTDITYSPCAP